MCLYSSSISINQNAATTQKDALFPPSIRCILIRIFAIRIHYATTKALKFQRNRCEAVIRDHSIEMRWYFLEITYKSNVTKTKQKQRQPNASKLNVQFDSAGAKIDCDAIILLFWSKLVDSKNVLFSLTLFVFLLKFARKISDSKKTTVLNMVCAFVENRWLISDTVKKRQLSMTSRRKSCVGLNVLSVVCLVICSLASCRMRNTSHWPVDAVLKYGCQSAICCYPLYCRMSSQLEAEELNETQCSNFILLWFFCQFPNRYAFHMHATIYGKTICYKLFR